MTADTDYASPTTDTRRPLVLSGTGVGAQLGRTLAQGSMARSPVASPGTAHRAGRSAGTGDYGFRIRASCQTLRDHLDVPGQQTLDLDGPVHVRMLPLTDPRRVFAAFDPANTRTAFPVPPMEYREIASLTVPEKVLLRETGTDHLFGERSKRNTPAEVARPVEVNATIVSTAGPSAPMRWFALRRHRVCPAEFVRPSGRVDKFDSSSTAQSA